MIGCATTVGSSPTTTTAAMAASSSNNLSSLLKVASLRYLVHLADNGLNGDSMLSEDEEERGTTDLEDGEDSMDSDRVVGGALNLVTTSPTDRLSNSSGGTTATTENNNASPPLTLNHHPHHHHHHHLLGHHHSRKNGSSNNNINNNNNNNNTSNNNNNHGVSNGHGSPPAATHLNHLTPSVQAALAALQAGQLSLNQVINEIRKCGIEAFL
jgi:hypothetical protein